MIGVHGLKQRSAWRRMPLIPIWDALSFGIWVASFLRRSIRWRGADYYIGENGALAPAASVSEP
jgi:ceramide glucosyltransferase